MKYYAQLNQHGIVKAVTENREETAAPHMIEIDFYDLSLMGKTWDGEKFFVPLAQAISDRVARVKIEASGRISALDWKVTREDERIKLKNKPDADYKAVLQERDDIRDASNQAEIDVAALTTVEEVENFTW